jgi:hypothetical protein
MGVLENYFLAAQKVIAGTTERLAAGLKTKRAAPDRVRLSQCFGCVHRFLFARTANYDGAFL